MRAILIIFLCSICLFKLNANNPVAKKDANQELLNYVKVSTHFRDYKRANLILNQLKWSLVCEQKANAELYELASNYMDSIRKFKRLTPALDSTKMAISSGKGDYQFDAISNAISNKQLERAIAQINELEYKIKIQKANDFLQTNLASSTKQQLVSYQKENLSTLKSKKKTSDINNKRILELEQALAKTDSATNWDVFSVLSQELVIRRRIKGFSDRSKYYSAYSHHQFLLKFLKNPKPRVREKPKKKVVRPESENYRKMIAVQKELKRKRQIADHMGTWQMVKEIEYRELIEKALDEGNTAKIKQLEEKIKALK